jgi:hypothetical protein
MNQLDTVKKGAGVDSWPVVVSRFKPNPFKYLRYFFLLLVFGCVIRSPLGV